MSSSGLPPAIKRFYESGQFADLTIICGSEKFRCHKIVLCSQSEFFNAACTGGFNYHPTTFLSNLIDLYALGDKYAISALCRHAAARFQKTISEISDCEFNLQRIPQIYGSVPENDTTLKDLLIAEIILRYCSYTRHRPGQGILLEAMDQYAEFRKDMTLGLLKNGKGSGTPEREESHIFGTRFSPLGQESPVFEPRFPPLGGFPSRP
ncbi:MAG: hypothetical protein Q9215_006941 [Flavoplaca cf. flavocitrina]